MKEEELHTIEQTYSESKIQHTCVAWFRWRFPQIGNLLVAIPNGGARSKKSGAMRKYEGQVKGVSDLILMYPRKDKATLCIEMKIPKREGRSCGTQSAEQKAWQHLAQCYGNDYVVCKGLIEFIECICNYLKIPNEDLKREALNNYFRFVR